VNCEQIQAILLQRIGGQPQIKRTQKLNKHIQDCPDCRAFQQQMNRLSEWIPEPQQEPEPITLENVKRFARLEAPQKRNKHTSMLLGATAVAASLLITIPLFKPVSHEFSMHETLAVDPAEQTNALLTDMLSEEDWAFQYALLAEF
jgi:predicted anti-sigma-YlaC factor YlaD